MIFSRCNRHKYRFELKSFGLSGNLKCVELFMNLKLNTRLADSYRSNSQIARVLTENWVKENSFCPNCKENNVSQYPNNQPVADFFCAVCREDFELKSTKKKFSKSITDGAYDKMIERITSENNPNLFLLTYSKMHLSVTDFLVVPKHFFEPSIIEKRNPLASTARRPGWVGCNINLQGIPELGHIFLVKNSVVADMKDVRETWHKSIFLRDKTFEAKGWTLDILKCLDSISSTDFSLDDVYKFEDKLKLRHPENNFVKDKIRQQLQILRDMDIIEFVGRGRYRKIK